MKLFAIWVIGFIAIVGVVSAQEAHQSIYETAEIGVLEWVDGSTHLKFEDAGSSTVASEWFLYTPETQTLLPLDDRLLTPLQRRLKDNTIAPLPISKVTQDPGLIFPSPDGRFAAYIVDKGETQNFDFALIDLTTDQTKILPYIHPYHPHNEKLVKVIWSGSSTAFAASIHNTDPGIDNYYVANISTGFEDITIRFLSSSPDSSDPMPLMDVMHAYAEDIFDVDSTGRYLLIDGVVYPTETDTGAVGTLVIDMVDLTYQRVDGSWMEATFQKPDDRFIHYLGRDGVYVFDRQTGQRRLRNAALNQNWIWYAKISPDGRYIAATGERRGKLYVIEIEPDSTPAKTP